MTSVLRKGTDRGRSTGSSGMCLVLAGSLFWTACGAPEPRDVSRGVGGTPSGETALFDERAAELGLDFEHWNGRTGELDLAEITCGGGGLVDIDDDGDLDVVFAQGVPLGSGDPLDPPPAVPGDRLYRNLLVESGELRFVDISAASGLSALPPGYGCGVAAADVDGDGRVDLLLLRLGDNRLLRNLGPDGNGVARFRDVTDAATAGDGRASVAGVFFDADADGRLDLLVANYVAFDPAQPPRCFDQSGAPDYCGPGAFRASPDQLLRNLGEPGASRFEDVTRTAGLDRAAPALGAVAADFDGDGRMDLYVANDGRPNHLWRNLGPGDPRQDGSSGGWIHFEDVALLAGAAVNADGAAEASMGVDAADVDGDGDIDLFLTHLLRETNTLYLNDGEGFFEDRTLASGLGAESLAFTSFGTGFFDYDNDGLLDLLVVSGAVVHIPDLVRRGDPFPLHQTNQLFRQVGGAGVRFEDVTSRAGAAFAFSEVSRAAAFGDVDNDGDTDVLVVNNGGPARLLVNRVGQDAPWIGLRLVGDAASPGDQIGARVEILRGGRPILTRWSRSAASYNAANDPRVLVGLGGAAPGDGAAIEDLRVTWPDGAAEIFRGVPTGRYTTLRRGEGALP